MDKEVRDDITIDVDEFLDQDMQDWYAKRVFRTNEATFFLDPLEPRSPASASIVDLTAEE
ncbi:hypothetical protein N7495_003362 [Penicillium taxi]|uniref:uncharacterized protein n=1 Tax=Penicillium taxi TaxID=168475 RepID=UPI00254588F0|nr:uncharacterized protein N7495_003362 [Penicillium taxi]KAJ5902834.1 hypothetical protein N7495_003362 [Penicillium taxi]